MKLRTMSEELLSRRMPCVLVDFGNARGNQYQPLYPRLRWIYGTAYLYSFSEVGLSDKERSARHGRAQGAQEILARTQAEIRLWLLCNFEFELETRLTRQYF